MCLPEYCRNPPGLFFKLYLATLCSNTSLSTFPLRVNLSIEFRKGNAKRTSPYFITPAICIHFNK